MTKLFGNLKTDGLEAVTDRLGGGFTPLDTGVYTGIVKSFYAGKSDGGANSITTEIELDNGKLYRETHWITNKQGENFFPNKQDATKKVQLPGFTVINDMVLVTTNSPLEELGFEEKVLNIYDYDAKKEMPKSVMVGMDVLGKSVTLAITKNIEDVTALQGSEYVPTGKTKETNTIAKVFHTETGMTVSEITHEASEPAFQPAWVERNKGQVFDKTSKTPNTPGTAGRPGGAAPVAGVNAAPKKSLFGK